MKMQGMKYPLETIFLAGMVDRLSQLVWMQTKDGMEGINQPKSVLAYLIGTDDEQTDIKGFDTAEDFENEWRYIVEGGKNEQ